MNKHILMMVTAAHVGSIALLSGLGLSGLGIVVIMMIPSVLAVTCCYTNNNTTTRPNTRINLITPPMPWRG